jgi:hypothetical protein
MLTFYLLTELPFNDEYSVCIGNILRHIVLKYFHRKVLSYSINSVLVLQILKNNGCGQDESCVYIPTPYRYPLLPFYRTETSADKSKSHLDGLTSLKSKQTHTQLSDKSDSSHWDGIKGHQPVSLDEQSFNENVILKEKFM